MSRHPDEGQLQDYVFGALPRNVEALIERHLAECHECRDDVAGLREVAGALRGLPRSVAPPRDLRPAIWRQVDGRPAGPAPAGATGPGASVSSKTALRSRTLHSVRWPLAAAALILIAVTAGLTAVLLRPGNVPLASDPAIAAVRAVEQEYGEAAAELERLIDEQKALLSPATLELLDETLRSIDAALADARTALADDPGNATLSRLLIAAWEKKLGVLQRASQAPIGI